MSAERKECAGLVEAALEISTRRAQNLREIKSLILEGEKDKAWTLLLKHLGIDEPKKRLSLVKRK